MMPGTIMSDVDIKDERETRNDSKPYFYKNV